MRYIVFAERVVPVGGWGDWHSSHGTLKDAAEVVDRIERDFNFVYIVDALHGDIVDRVTGEPVDV